ncbi:MAG: Flp pilus assembly protein CpaB [Deltaproteobacteria bacterium]|nr:Flp pilus assembly protein CpaB [Deltaproteobacteria bacterium]
MARNIFSGKMGILIPAALALLAMLLTYQYIHQKERDLGFLAEPIPVLMVNQNVPRLTRLDQTMLAVEQIPRRFVQPGALTDMADAVDQVTIVPMLQGEQVLGTKLVAYGAETGLAVKIPKGLRAVTLALTEQGAVAGLIKPGDFVDIIGTFEFGDFNKSDQRTYTLLQSVLVLAVDQNMGIESEAARAVAQSAGNDRDRQALAKRAMAMAGKQDRPNVTLGLLPDQIQKVVLAQETGTIALSLRSMFEDRSTIKVQPTDMKELLGIQEQVSVSPLRWREYRGGREGFGIMSE